VDAPWTSSATPGGVRRKPPPGRRRMRPRPRSMGMEDRRRTDAIALPTTRSKPVTSRRFRRARHGRGSPKPAGKTRRGVRVPQAEQRGQDHHLRMLLQAGSRDLRTQSLAGRRAIRTVWPGSAPWWRSPRYRTSGRDSLPRVVARRRGSRRRHRSRPRRSISSGGRATGSNVLAGDAARLGVAAALSKTGLLILDEPTNGLHPAGMAEIRH
jgi:hypothetical protein